SDAPALGPEQSSDFCGIHHIGFVVDDQRTTVAELEAANVQHVKNDQSPPRRTGPTGLAPNEKFIGPDWVHFDVREKGWNEAIRPHTQLYELKPENAAREAVATAGGGGRDPPPPRRPRAGFRDVTASPWWRIESWWIEPKRRDHDRRRDPETSLHRL